LSGCATGGRVGGKLYDISLAEWSFNKSLRGQTDTIMTNLDFPAQTRALGIGAVEYVNQFFFDKAKDTAYLTELRNRCDSEGVKSLLIMCDRLGALGDRDNEKRTRAVENHYAWVEAAKFLGCHSIRVNAQSSGSYNDTQKLAADGLGRLSEFAKPYGVNVIVENHGGNSSNGEWLAETIAMVGMDNCGSLPDFGNFLLSPRNEKPEFWYDRYRGVAELMPSAKAVSAKSHDFDENGNEINTDYLRMMKIVVDAGYRGYVGIEYEGRNLSEVDGVLATKRLLERVREELA
jgi:sugar phosphate isomerase/epimerase